LVYEPFDFARFRFFLYVIQPYRIEKPRWY
jgi:hypothetical protein